MGLGFTGFQLPHVSMPGPNATAAQLVNSFNQSQAASTASSQDLFNRAAGGIDRTVGEQKQALAGSFNYLRNTNRANIRSIDRDFAKQSGSMMQDLIDSGLGNATIQGAMATGLQRAHSDALSGARAAFGDKMFKAAQSNALANSGLQMQGIMGLLSNTNIGFPDAGAFASLIAASGAAGAGGGGGGYGNGGTVAYDPSRPIGGPRPAWTYQSPQVAFEGGGGGGYASLADQAQQAAQTQPVSAANLYAMPSMPTSEIMNFVRGAVPGFGGG